jgi:uncharacterized protein YjbI with pentapeptide repeats
MTYLARVLLWLRNWFRVVFQWSRPSHIKTIEDPDEWHRQHDEISQTVLHIMGTLIATCLFCLLTLGAPDVSLISTDATIRIPVANTDISYTGFLLFGPIILIGLTFYLHVFLEQLFYLAPASDRYPLPFLFNLPRREARLLSRLILYWMVPAILAVFTWKALPRVEAPLLVIMTSATIAIVIGLQIRHFPRPTGSPLPFHARIFLVTLWLVWASALGVLLLQFAQLMRPVLLQTTGTSTLLLPSRSLNLYNAQLNNKDLSRLNLSYANLRKANLKESDLEDTTLAYADLRKADLSGANLTAVDFRNADLRGAILSDANLRRADLREVKIDDFTKMDDKWKMVWCLLNNQSVSLPQGLCPPHPVLAWRDLSGADLRYINLQGVELIGTDLSGADLRGTDLMGADLRLADVRGTNLGENSLTEMRLDGALSNVLQPNAMETALVMSIQNRTTRTCLDLDPTKPLVEGEEGILPIMSECDASKQTQHWKIKRNNLGEIFIQNATNANKPFCLDKTSIPPANEVEPHMWVCNDDYLNQRWKVMSIEDPKEGYVLLSIIAADFCLDSTGVREPGINPHLWTCSRSIHNQHWQLTFSMD